MEHRRVVLALGGGAARGLAHIGVLKGLEEEGVEVAGVAGTSMGAIVGALYAQGVTASEIELLVQSMDWPSMGRVFLGSVVGELLHDLLREVLGDARIEDLALPYAAVCCDVEEGTEVVIRSGPVADAARASSAIPGVLPPLRLDGRSLIDGAVVAPVPVRAASALANYPVLAVHVLRPAAGRPAELGMATPAAADGRPPSVFRRVEGWLNRQHRNVRGRIAEIPRRWEVLMRSLEIMEHRLAFSDCRPDACIEPEVGGFGLFEFARAAEIIAEGHRAYREWSSTRPSLG